MNNIRRTHKEYKNLVRKIHGNKLIPIQNYINARTSIKHLCNKGHTYIASPQYVLKNKGCGICIKQTWKGKTHLTQGQFVIKLNKMYKGKIVPIQKYKGMLPRIKFKCDKGHTIKTSPSSLLNNKRVYGCLKCSYASSEKTSNDWIKHYKSKIKNCISIKPSITNKKKIISLYSGRCKAHGFMKILFNLNPRYLKYFLYPHDKYIGINFQELFFMFSNNIRKRPICYCGNDVKYSYERKKYRLYCSRSCLANSSVNKNKMRRTNLRKYGVPYSILMAGKAETFTLKNKTFKTQGYEKIAITSLSKTIHPNEILAGLSDRKFIPVIKYLDYDNNERLHYPDIYIKKKNLIIEVKSTWTMGINYNRKLFIRCKRKCRSALKQGYKYRVYLYGERSRNIYKIKLPKYWYTMKYKDVCNSI